MGYMDYSDKLYEINQHKQLMMTLIASQIDFKVKE